MQRTGRTRSGRVAVALYDWWKPHSTPPPPDDAGNIFLPPMAISQATLWQLRDRMARAMDAPVMMVVEGPAPHRYRLVESEADLEALGRTAKGIRLMAGSGLSLHDGTLHSSGHVGMNFDFPPRRAGNASLFGATERFGPHQSSFEETVDWLVREGRYRWGWLPVVRIGGAIVFAVLIAGLVAALLAALEGPYVWLSVPFVGLSGLLTAWGFVSGARRLTGREHERLRGVVVRRR